MGEFGAVSNDPTVHVLTLADFQNTPDGCSIRSGLALAELAQDAADDLEGARRDEGTIENDWRTGQVAFSRVRATVLVSLLQELAARVQPGFTCGPMRGGNDLADLCAELAATLEAKRAYSPDYD